MTNPNLPHPEIVEATLAAALERGVIEDADIGECEQARAGLAIRLHQLASENYRRGSQLAADRAITEAWEVARRKVDPEIKLKPFESFSGAALATATVISELAEDPESVGRLTDAEQALITAYEPHISELVESYAETLRRLKAEVAAAAAKRIHDYDHREHHRAIERYRRERAALDFKETQAAITEALPAPERSPQPPGPRVVTDTRPYL